MRRLRYRRVAFLIIVAIAIIFFTNTILAISKVIKIEKFEPISEEDKVDVQTYVPNETRVINVTEYIYDGIEIVFDLSQSINLELSSADDIYIKALDKLSGKSIIEKNKTWDQYILDTEDYKVKNGIINPGTYKIRFTQSELNNIDEDNINIDFFIKKDGEEIYNN